MYRSVKKGKSWEKVIEEWQRNTGSPITEAALRRRFYRFVAHLEPLDSKKLALAVATVEDLAKRDDVASIVRMYKKDKVDDLMNDQSKFWTVVGLVLQCWEGAKRPRTVEVLQERWSRQKKLLLSKEA